MLQYKKKVCGVLHSKMLHILWDIIKEVAPAYVYRLEALVNQQSS